MSTRIYDGVNLCDCGNLFVANSKGICLPCHRAARQVVFSRRAEAREARRQAKIAQRIADKKARDA
ncbi:hypothetical protein LCGC14_1808840 [marine sediment metagenome]|uniref:Uncharacterized protein n=1 Tax=marine sediment metagenome TaxID=412755 RepID=A0A0F9J251_9ZZZZ